MLWRVKKRAQMMKIILWMLAIVLCTALVYALIKAKGYLSGQV
jgi:hypothetical protein